MFTCPRRRIILLDTRLARPRIAVTGTSRLAERSVLAAAIFSTLLQHGTGRPKLQ